MDFLHETNGVLKRLRNNDLVQDLKDFDRLARKAPLDKELTIEAKV